MDTTKTDQATVTEEVPVTTSIPSAIQARFDELTRDLDFSQSPHHKELLEKAFRFANNAHYGQTRISGDPYITHPLEVMGILVKLHVDTVTLVGALLHDVVEDTGVEIENIAHEFGPVVAILVDGMTKLSAIRYNTRSNEEQQAEYFRKMLLSMAQDLRVILIKLADRLHNMRTIDVMSPRAQKRIAQETLEIYAPLAHRFGIGRIKWELEDLSLKVIDEAAYRRISERVVLSREDRESAVDSIINPLKERLEAENLKASISGRAKHFYSIYNKIKRRGKSFEEILDLLAVRIVVESIPDCYRVLGVVHSLFTPISERFSDYIAMPKANMYQSIHTKVIDLAGRTVEIQIRTKEMNHVSEVGIAAHWQYKEKGDNGNEKRSDNLRDYYSWLRALIEGSREDDSSEEFMKTLKINLFTDEIYVFTPKGKLIQLPKGATPVDFAFAVHTDVGLRSLGAKVNGRMEALDTPLHNGDKVEILTSVNASPSVDWLRFVHTSSARTKIRKYFKQASIEDSIRLGREILDKEVARYRKKLSKKEIGNLVNSFGLQSEEAFFTAIGSGELSSQKVIDRILGVANRKTSDEVDSKTQHIRILSSPPSDEAFEKTGPRFIFGRCCSPLPGDRIIGNLEKPGEIVVHRTECPNVSDFSHKIDQLVELEWDVQRDDRFNARLRIFAEDRKYLLRDVSDIIGKQDVTIFEANLRTEGGLAVGTFLVNVRGLSHLSRLNNRIMRIKGIVQVERVNVSDVAEKIV